MLGQTIAVVDHSGKIVKHSQHLMSVFKEARSAYQERKAEITAARKDQELSKRSKRAHTIDENLSTTSSRHSRRDGERKRSIKRRHSGDTQRKPLLYSINEATTASEETFRNPWTPEATKTSKTPNSPLSPARGISRSHTVKAGGIHDSYFPPVPLRAKSMCAVDMDLAYGEPPPNLFASEAKDEVELKGLVGNVRKLLDEANCLQYSATQTINTLQRNPDAMAAVALSLAEISNLVKKMSPGVLLQLKGAAPSVFALLASPQFMVAAGVGVGVTIVAFGGYKIVKKIQERKVVENEMDQMIELSADVSRIDQWRRGIATAEAESVGTSVDGEFITPMAASMSRLNLEELEKPRESTRKNKSRSPRSEKTSRTAKSSTSKPSRSSGSQKERSSKEKSSRSIKEKKPSPLRLMFS